MVGFAAVGLAAAQSANDGQEYPPNAKPGECWAKCVTKPKYENYTEQVLVKEASKRVEVVPGTYETATEQVMVRPASKRLEVIPAVYDTETERVVIKEAAKRLVKVPAVYEDVTERIEVSPASTRWEKGKATAACLSANPEDCRVWCLVEVPAQHKMITKRVLKTPETTREIEIPAEYANVTKRVLRTAATTREIEVPAEYKTVTRTVMNTPPTSRETDIPAEYRTVTHRRQVSDSTVSDWRRVLCEQQLTSDKIRQIQMALKEKGFDPGPIDNVFGTQTKEALSRYQRENKLPEGNLDFETLKSLGLES
jgi:hypothetical protein